MAEQIMLKTNKKGDTENMKNTETGTVYITIQLMITGFEVTVFM